MANDYIESVLLTQMVCELLGEVNRAVPPPGAAERNHQAFETAALVLIDAGIHKGLHVGKKLVDARLLVEEVDHGRVFTC
jgi:hypothetical protein